MTPTVVRIDADSPHGRLLDASVPLIGVEDQGFARGDGIFETMLAVDGVVRKPDSHLRRLAHSARLLELPLAEDETAWRAAVDLALSEAPEGTPTTLGREHTVKMLISRGDAHGAYGLVIVSPVPAATVAARRDGVRAVLVPRGHDPAEDMAYPWLLAGAKTLSYAMNMAVQRHARSLGAQDAIFTASDRRVLEGATSSVVAARKDRDGLTLLTPEPSNGILPGTTQGAIFQGARQAGWDLGFGPLHPADLLTSDGMWLVSSVRLVAPVTSLDGQALPVDPKLTERLMGFLVGR